MNRPLVITASIVGCLAVIQGAFGAHALKAQLTAEQLAIYHTGVEYQFYHVFAVLAAAWVARQGSPGYAISAGWCFVVGILLFSGSIYILATARNEAVRAVMGPITPIGGTILIVGWVLLATAAALGGRGRRER